MYSRIKFHQLKFAAFQSWIGDGLSKTESFRTLMDCFQQIGVQFVVRFIDRQIQLIETENMKQQKKIIRDEVFSWNLLEKQSQGYKMIQVVYQTIRAMVTS